jgi:feruloyl esterase
MGLAAAAAGLALLAGVAQAAPSCASLTSAALPHAAVTSASDEAAGKVAACKIDVTARPTADSDIRIEVWIPEGAAWNGRYVQFGNGGFAGQIASARLQAVAAEGYAVAMTDDGHQSKIGTDASWAVGHPARVVDFGWRALKETTNAAKALIRLYQGGPVKYAYFQGCSDGGREALMEAQRFPDDFDGIIAGAPAYNFSGLLTLAAFDQQALAKPGAYLDADALKALQAGALAACGGGAYIADPLSCRFDPASVACPPGELRAGCLSPAQVAAARAIEDGLKAPGLTYPGNSPGAEMARGGWQVWITGASAEHIDQALSRQFGAGFWADLVFGDPGYDILKLDLAKAHAEAAQAAKVVDSTDPDLRRFRAHGGKLIQYHGWNDPAIPARGSIVYYEDVRGTMGDVSSFYRLYLIPGMLHCGGGPGPSTVDWLGALRGWVEDHQAPVGLIAESAPGAPPARQPLCPYPASGWMDEKSRLTCMSISIVAPPPPPR